MKLTDRQAEFYRELVSELGPADALSFWNENVAGRWREWSRPPTEAEKMVTSFMEMASGLVMIKSIVERPEIIGDTLAGIADSLRFVLGQTPAEHE